MTVAGTPQAIERYDVRTIVGGGVKLGLLTAVGVTAFALLSRALDEGGLETLLQSLLVLAGGTVTSYAPAWWVRPRTIDGIAWTATLGLVGSVAFTVVDTSILRPVNLYHWSWDAIGGGSGFWYIPIWWMGATFLAWLGAWVASCTTPGTDDLNNAVLKTLVWALVFHILLVLLGIAPFHAATAALAYTLGLVTQVVMAALSRRGE